MTEEQTGDIKFYWEILKDVQQELEAMQLAELSQEDKQFLSEVEDRLLSALVKMRTHKMFNPKTDTNNEAA